MTQPTAVPTQDEKTMALIAHFGALIAWFVAPLIVYLVKKDESKYAAFHALQALYFSLACSAIIFFTSFLLIGLFLWPIPIVFHIIAGVKIAGGNHYEYPVFGKMARQKIYGA
ncbi:DUF4870 domain-containing protein [Vulgatibacter sp.]|uniref:DUF4870 domain-containing protein n=1 Tax=Vulgatibacter sp. TaxID=1971226 RepID=UPI0035617017